MRVFFLLVILANVLLFLWETKVRHPGNDRDSASKTLILPGTTESITLISESRAIPVSAIPAENRPVHSYGKPDSPAFNLSDTPVVTAPVQSADKFAGCFEIGPFPTPVAASELQVLLASQAKGITVSTRSTAQNDSWWVLIPKADSMEAAKARRQMLLDRGVKDFWLFNKGELQGAISLGLHETREKAEASRRQFLEKGIVSEVAPRATHSDSYWLRIPWPRSRLALDEVLQTLKMQNAELTIPAPAVCH